MTDNHQQQEGLMLLERASDDRARRAARRVGLIARKSRCRVGSIDNFGGFALIDPRTNCAVAGGRFDLSAEYVIVYCNADERG
jgi:hypothetical protein